MSQFTNGERPPRRGLLAAATLTLAYVIAMGALNVGCPQFFMRPDNLVAIAVSLLAVGVMAFAALNTSQTAVVGGLLAAGVITGLYLQPSSAILLAAVTGTVGMRMAAQSPRRGVTFLLLTIGVAIGVLLLFALMSTISPAQLRCPSDIR